MGRAEPSPTGTRDSTVICVWSPSTGERLLRALRHNSNSVAAKFPLDGRLLATASCEGYSIRIYHGRDGCLLVDMPIEVDRYDQFLAWTYDGKHLCALSEGDIICLDVSTRRTLSQWSIPGVDDHRGTVLARNGRFIVASADTTPSFWDTMIEKQIGPVIEHDENTLAMVISTVAQS